MSLLIWGVSMLGFVISFPVTSRGGFLTVLLILVVVNLFFIPYVLARLGRAHTAILVSCLSASAGIVVVAALSGDSIATTSLYYLVMVCIYAATFLSVHAAALLTITHCLIILLLGMRLGGDGFMSVVAGPLAFNIVGAGFVLMFVHFWRVRERQKRDGLAISEARYRAVSEHMSDYMYFARLLPDGSRVIVWDTNQFKTLTGFTTDELGDDTFMKIVHPDDRALLNDGRTRIRAGQATRTDVRIARKDGDERWLRIERLPVHEAEGTLPTSYYGIIVDITEEHDSRQAQEELTLRRAQFSMIDTFVKAISHDFRNRLSSIETTRYLIGRQVSPDSLERIKPRLEQISSHIDDMMMQLTNLMLVNSLNNPYLNPVSVNDLCQAVSNKFTHQAREKSLDLRLALAEVEPILTADAEQLERALTHLLRNALTHTSVGGVTLRTTVEREWAIIEVEDTGSGIDAENLPLIFEPFYRGDEARTVTHAGVGLGLTLVRLIVEAHHGTIAVDSEPGQGTTFRIALPIHVRNGATSQ